MKKQNSARSVILAILALMSGVLLLASNLAATKLWNFCGIAVDAGILVFPLSYVVGDAIVEIYGAKLSKNVIWATTIVNLIVMLILWSAVYLPAFPGWEMQEEYAAIFGFAPRIALGSLTAYAASQLLNNLVFEKMRWRTGRHLSWRTLGSSVVARLVDSAIFETVAFLGVLPIGDFLWQLWLAYTAGTVIEIVLTPLGCWVIRRLKRWTGEFEAGPD